MDSEIFDLILNEYEKERDKNKKERDLRVERVYSDVPEIMEIDKKIAQVGSESLRSILANPDDKTIKAEMRKKFDILSQRRNLLLQQNGIPSDFDKIRYRCELCKDTGYIENKGRCTCFRQKVINNLYKQSNMSELLTKQNFANFDLSYYDKKPIQGLKHNPYDNMKNIRNHCIKFVENFDKADKNLIFYGGTGLGKTFMSSCIAKALMDKGKTVLYLRASQFFRMCDDERFGRLTDGMDDVYKADLLIIDDLGTETEMKNNNSYLLEFINERLISGRKIIINTNLNFDSIEKRYSKRFSSRLLENFDMMYFYGEDIRRQKLFKKKRENNKKQ